jgi:predicted XRE-type DNA-binding protein
MMDEIKVMKAYLADAEAFVDRVYHFAMEKGSVADELRSDMNAAGNLINNANGLLNKLGMSKEEMLEKLELAQSLLSDVYHGSCDCSDTNLESLMSAADSCILEAIDHISKEK